MSAQLLEVVLKQADQLTSDEQLVLASRLIERSRRTKVFTGRPKRKWKDVCGTLPYPAFGEDAQVYISRTRRESDEHRERALKRVA